MPTVHKIIRPWMQGSATQKAKNQGGNQANREVYDTHRHRQLRKAYLEKNPLCVICYREKRLEPATVFDHIVAINDGGDPWDDSNKQGLCRSCHQKKRNSERRNINR